MNRIVAMMFALALAIPSVVGAEDASKMSLDNPTDKMSYALGVDIGANLKTLPVEVNYEVLLKGVRDIVDGKDLLLSAEEVNATKRELAMKVQAERAKVRAEQGEKNQKEGAAFLEANKAKEGVVTTESGIQYKVITEGTGPKPSAESKVKVNYRGTLVDGTEFDSSYKRGTPATFPVNGVIKGWTEILQMMPVGSKWQVAIPADLAYGERGAGAAIGPNATLVFEVELLGIEE